MVRTAPPSLSSVTRPQVNVSAQPRALSPAISTGAQVSQGVKSPSANAHRGVSAFESAAGGTGVRAPIVGRDVASDIRTRLNTVLGRIPGYMAQADRIAMPLTAAEMRMIANAPPEMQAALRAQIQRKHEATAQQLRAEAAWSTGHSSPDGVTS